MKALEGKSQGGFALWLVVAGLVMIGFVLAGVLINSKRNQDQSNQELEKLRFNEFTNRVKNIFEVTQLCSCNLYGLRPPVISTKPMVFGNLFLDKANGSILKPKFGVHPNPNNTPGSPATPCGLLSDDRVTLSFLPLTTQQNYLVVDQVRLEHLSITENLPNEIYRAKAELVFVASQIQNAKTIARSNLSSPVKMDVYLELEKVANEWQVKNCYEKRNKPVANKCGEWKQIFTETNPCAKGMFGNCPNMAQGESFTDACLPGASCSFCTGWAVTDWECEATAACNPSPASPAPASPPSKTYKNVLGQCCSSSTWEGPTGGCARNGDVNICNSHSSNCPPEITFNVNGDCQLNDPVSHITCTSSCTVNRGRCSVQFDCY